VAVNQRRLGKTLRAEKPGGGPVRLAVFDEVSLKVDVSTTGALTLVSVEAQENDQEDDQNDEEDDHDDDDSGDHGNDH